MTSEVSQKESSLGIRIYLYIIGLVCLSTNVWFASELDKQVEYKQQDSKQLKQELTQENKNPLMAVISSEVVSASSHSALE